MSAFRARRRTTAWPSGVRRFAVTDFLFLACTYHHSEVPSCSSRHCLSGSPPGLFPSAGGSILTTSAPNSANILPANGSAMSCPSSSTLMPLSGPFDEGVEVACIAVGPDQPETHRLRKERAKEQYFTTLRCWRPSA